MGISFADLPLKYREQAMQKYAAQERRKKAAALPAGRKSKYNNQPDERSGIKFDSRKEARRYDELLIMLRAGKIKDLRLQVDFTLQEAYTTAGGERVRAIRYRADFTYLEHREHADDPVTGVECWAQVIEDVKSKATVTPSYSVKKKMLMERFGLSIMEV